MRKLFKIIAVSALLISVLSETAYCEPENISAKSAIIVEAETGDVIWSYNSDDQLKIASTTKILTAVTVLDICDDIEREISVSPDACNVEGSSVYLKPNERLTVRELLCSMLLESANDAAAALAMEFGGSIQGFALLMNRKAEELGMISSHFDNPHGLDSETHYSTASDLAKLSVYAMKNPVFREIVSTFKTNVRLNGNEGVRVLINHNKLLSLYEGAIGIKTGFTKASGRCLVSSAERNGVKLIAVTLCAPDDWNDHKKLLDYGFSRLKHYNVLTPGELKVKIPVTGGTSDEVILTNTDGFEITLPTDVPEPEIIIESKRFLFVPVTRDYIYGCAVVKSGDRIISEIPLYAEDDVPSSAKPGLFKRILELYR